MNTHDSESPLWPADMVDDAELMNRHALDTFHLRFEREADLEDPEDCRRLSEIMDWQGRCCPLDHESQRERRERRSISAAIRELMG